VDLLFSPRVLARAVMPWIASLLALVGIASIGFERFIARPEVVRFSKDGRRVTGTVIGAPPANISDTRADVHRNRSLVGVNDQELGPQVVSVYGALPKGTTVPMLCLTPAGHCMSAPDVSERLDLWPLTPLMLSGTTELGLATLLALVVRRRRMRRAAAHKPPRMPAISA
jgi:hypothetical protein